ncbi:MULTISPECIES: phosphoglycerate kinase [Aerococcus]|uniref:Phosphoglycerate kinase n=2 Tax=Aerococcus TaxID=1375 RepID=A0A178HDY1_9LACT|nr:MULTISPECIES: phosphoglycerate kinase [Aerococcus]KAA9218657.1 phosphoglycerate kinase [Aerococcus loyolae]KAA9265040.1 phosphoglycerate kinase [Aerococcus loyolae]MCY3025887.1 phosphoglycerate kinase [Aerococcus loyolae]MCY3027738.1 phosphoglycerate kinase [Aerococcus loyolae]MCY3029643.1 phosphoglycerate kinase [Aerococcus loyolae]
MAKETVKDVNVQGKKILMRVDFNVPMKDGEITDDNRMVQALPTIKYVIEQGGKLILFSHLGKVKSEEDKKDKSLAPVAKHLEELLGQKVVFVPATRGQELEEAIDQLNDGEVLLFENTRFEDVDGKKESGNDPELGKYWASLGDGIFVNDAFGTAHRAHASNVGISANVDHAVAGFLMEKELNFLGDAVNNPKRPFVAILGGAKVSDKIAVIESLLNKADKVLIGGGMAYTFLKAKGYEVGNSLLEEDRVSLAKEIMEKAGDKLYLPVDVVVADDFSNDANTQVVAADAIPEGWEGLDSGPKTNELFAKQLEDAKTVVWNGPMGVFEMEKFAIGTNAVCKAVADLDDAITIVGGGDSASAAKNSGFAEKFSHISTGGGASLQFLEGNPLPGVEALSEK